MNSEQVDIGEGFHETFRIHIVWRIMITIGALIITFCLIWIPLICVVFLNAFLVEDHYAWSNIVPAVLVLLFLVSSYLILLVVSTLSTTWRTWIRISGNGIRCRAFVLFRQQLLPWEVLRDCFFSREDIIGIRRFTGGECHIVVAGGRFIDVSLFARKRRILELVDAMLSKSEREDQLMIRLTPIEQIRRQVFPLAAVLVIPIFFMVSITFFNYLDREPERQEGLVFKRIYTQELGTPFGLMSRLFVGDSDGDGKPDLFYNPRRVSRPVRGGFRRIDLPGGVYEQKKGAFVRSRLRTSFSKADRCTILTMGDVDGNGRMDLLLKRLDITLLEWDGKEFKVKWQAPVSTAFPSFLFRTGQVVATDLDGDGTDEIITPGKVYKWDGKQLIEEHAFKTPHTTGYELQTCDLDDDGTIEVVLAAFGEGSVVVAIYSSANGVLEEKARYIPDSCASYFEPLYVADVDHDGRDEIVMFAIPNRPGPPYDNRIVLIGFEDGEFFEVLTNVGVDSFIAYAGDLYGTGRDVILTISEKGLLSVYSLEE